MGMDAKWVRDWREAVVLYALPFKLGRSLSVNVGSGGNHADQNGMRGIVCWKYIEDSLRR